MRMYDSIIKRKWEEKDQSKKYTNLNHPLPSQRVFVDTRITISRQDNGSISWKYKKP